MTGHTMSCSAGSRPYTFAAQRLTRARGLNVHFRQPLGTSADRHLVASNGSGIGGQR